MLVRLQRRELLQPAVSDVRGKLLSRSSWLRSGSTNFALDQRTSLSINTCRSDEERVINLVNVYCPACMHVAMTVNQMIVNQI